MPRVDNHSMRESDTTRARRARGGLSLVESLAGALVVAVIGSLVVLLLRVSAPPPVTPSPAAVIEALDEATLRQALAQGRVHRALADGTAVVVTAQPAPGDRGLLNVEVRRAADAVVLLSGVWSAPDDPAP